MIHTEKNLPQKSKEWIEFRSKGIGASEIPIITGKFTFWCDDYELFLRKMGKITDFSNQYIEDGNEFEPYARNAVTNYLKNCDGTDESEVFCKNVYDRTGGFDLKDVNFEQYTVQHKEFPYIFSSYDGIDIENKLVLEIKSPSQATFTKLLKNRKPTIPKMYIDQIQMQLWTAYSHWGITEGIFAIFFKDGVYTTNKKTGITKLTRLILIKTELDLEYCKEIKEVCDKYIKMIENRQWDNDWKLK